MIKISKAIVVDMWADVKRLNIISHCPESYSRLNSLNKWKKNGWRKWKFEIEEHYIILLKSISKLLICYCRLSGCIVRDLTKKVFEDYPDVAHFLPTNPARVFIYICLSVFNLCFIQFFYFIIVSSFLRYFIQKLRSV